MELANGGSSSNAQFGVEKLVGTNYKYWRMCMEAYLLGQDLWDLIVGAEADIPANTPENAEPRRKWKIKCELDPDEKIGEARMRRFLIRGLKESFHHLHSRLVKATFS
uniref:Uncharacterized protein LOC104231940 n=1 Tax=Nicotiana sylvestris TaxID=4096 RepID=A0A1U7X0X2_NICSY|nr:PREDICTED: uncharacterized protein LOC104231940 [Nicotiana sylvestris]